MDYMVSADAADHQIRAFGISSRELVEEARKTHNTSPVATAALGRTMSGTLMMAESMLKNDKDVITVRIQGDGPLSGITVTADHHGNVKGYVGNPDVILPANAQGHLNVGGAVGKGTLTVIRDMGLKEPYVGQTELHSGEIAEDLTYYFMISEQIPSSVGLGVLMNKDNTVAKAGGFIVQLLPFASEDVIAKLEKNLSSLRPVTEILREGARPEDLLRIVLDGFDVEYTGTIPVQLHCDCSRDRVRRALKLIDRKELEEIAAEGKDTELGCGFCGKKYVFTAAEVKKMLDER